MKALALPLMAVLAIGGPVAASDFTDELQGIVESMGDFDRPSMDASIESLVQMDVPVGCHDEWLEMLKTFSAMSAIYEYGIEAENVNGMLNGMMAMEELTGSPESMVLGLFTCEL